MAILFNFVANDGTVNSSPATVSVTVGQCNNGLPLPFVDDFESDLGWTVNPSGTDLASGGLWERADPQPTNDQGDKQLGDTVSGSLDLVTGALSFGNASKNDLDGGLTSICSPRIQLPTGQDITLSLNYYFAHGRNSSSADYFRVQIVGTPSTTVLEVRGKNQDVDAAWRSFGANLNSFAGQSIFIMIEAADLGKDSLIEAGVDNVSITAAAPGTPLLSANFDSGADGFTYSDDLFRSTNQPLYAVGIHLPAAGVSGGGLQVSLGGLDTAIIEGFSGGWQGSFTLAAVSDVTISVWFKLTQSPDYEAKECSQALLSVDGSLYGSGTHEYIAEICGNGNGGSEESTGWQQYSVTLEDLPVGVHTLIIGGYNNRKSYTNETTEMLVDRLLIISP